MLKEGIPSDPSNRSHEDSQGRVFTTLEKKLLPYLVQARAELLSAGKINDTQMTDVRQNLTHLNNFQSNWIPGVTLRRRTIERGLLDTNILDDQQQMHLDLERTRIPEHRGRPGPEAGFNMLMADVSHLAATKTYREFFQDIDDALRQAGFSEALMLAMQDPRTHDDEFAPHVSPHVEKFNAAFQLLLLKGYCIGDIAG